MKKFFLFCLCLTLLACGDKDKPNPDTTSTDSTPTDITPTDGTPTDATPTDAPEPDFLSPDATEPDATTTDASDCEILVDPETGQNVSCMGENPGEEIDCPEGYTCSGLSAFWCYKGSCNNLPICLSHDAEIDTPNGPVRVTELRVGTMVWTRSLDGRRVAAPVVRLGSVTAPVDHRMVRVILNDGRTFRASPGHPMADGTDLGTLMTGQFYNGAGVALATMEAYEGARTYDLLPAGATGQYWVNGVLLSSTLSR